MPKELTPRQAKFVAAYVAGATAVDAARQAGYPEGSVKSRSQFMLHKCAATVAAIAAGKKALQINANFDALQAFKELDDAIANAVKWGQASAIVKAIETKARLVGLIDKDKGKLHLDIDLNGIRQQLQAGRDRIDAWRRAGSPAGGELRQLTQG